MRQISQTAKPIAPHAAIVKIANKPFISISLIWCPKRDSNSHAEAHGPKPCVSTNSTIGAFYC